MTEFTLLIEDRERTVDTTINEDHLYVPNRFIEKELGWILKDRGLCREETCVPVPDSEFFVKDDMLELNQLAELIHRPLAAVPEEGVAYLGPPYRHDRDLDPSDNAPDVTLPDLEGTEHSLSDFEGNKIFLLVWASW